ncbi:GNAT family N-acetyltransferase [Streptomyces sp. NBC_00237]|uniref:GNAT family N-acetyltransferase n=1 Tax=Streptomyces sp. NBC_00237 TaxID=2975687 RepID=UPI002252E445|nr:N-acetyltransferase [Streptomyces sp. NBC_00237]MCX5201845.1 GNAT family N-acetyltransferase [Streptomyces sp. NBC_00237]
MRDHPEENSAKRGESFAVRPVTEDDLPELFALDQEVFGKHGYPYFMLRQLFDAHQGRLLVVDARDVQGTQGVPDPGAGRLAGYALTVNTYDRKTSWVFGLGVSPGCRHRGVGRALLAEALRMSAEDGVAEVWLSVEPGNRPAIALYRSLGFGPGEFRADYLGPGDHRLLMRCALGWRHAQPRPR